MGNIIFGSKPITIADSVYITIVSMMIVFSILILLTFILYLFKYIPKEKKAVSDYKTNNLKEKYISNSTKFSEKDIEDDDMLAAIMVACIEASNNSRNGNIRVKSVKRLN